jgi:hypothetical protein
MNVPHPFPLPELPEGEGILGEIESKIQNVSLAFQADGDRDREFGSFADFTLDADIAAHEIDESSNDCEP